MALDPAISLGVKVPDQMQSIGNLLQVAQGAQALQKARATFQVDVAQRQAESARAETELGLLKDTYQSKVAQEAGQAAQQTAAGEVATANVMPSIAIKAQEAKQAELTTQQKSLEYRSALTQHVLQGAGSLLASPAIQAADKGQFDPDAMHSSVWDVKQQLHSSGVDPATIERLTAPITAAIDKQPAAVPGMVRQALAAASKSASETASILNPQIQPVATGQTTSFPNVSATAGPVGQPALPTAQQELPPTTPVVRQSTDAQGNPTGLATPGYLGPTGSPSVLPTQTTPAKQPAMTWEQIQAMPAGQAQHRAIIQYMNSIPMDKRSQVVNPLPVGPASGTAIQSGPAVAAGPIEGSNIDIVKADRAQNLAALERNRTLIPLMQESKKYIGKALTGNTTEHQQLVAGIAGFFGMQPAQDAKTNTDLLMKNARLAALAGNGKTDAAREIAELVSPNPHMTEDAGKVVADKITAMAQLENLRAQYLSAEKAANPTGYVKDMQNFDSNTDYRTFLLQTMDPKEKAKFVHELSDSEYKDLLEKAGRTWNFNKQVQLGRQ